MKIKIIACIGKENELGAGNDLIWDIPADKKRFRSLTLGATVIMGRKTWESLSEQFRPLPNRTNIVLTRDTAFTTEGALVANSVEDVLQYSQELGKDLWIIGGAEVYQLFMDKADEMHLTIVHDSYEFADVYFPEFKYQDWLIDTESIDKRFYEKENIHFSFSSYTRNNKA